MIAEVVGDSAVISHAVFVIIFAAAIGSGLVARIFFAFSSLVMAALGRLPSDHGIAAMNAINVTVINPTFFLAFFGTAALCLAGCIAVTMLRNVPLNNALAAVTLGAPEAAALWTRYLGEWTFWNTMRTVAPIVSAVLFTIALL